MSAALVGVCILLLSAVVWRTELVTMRIWERRFSLREQELRLRERELRLRERELRIEARRLGLSDGAAGEGGGVEVDGSVWEAAEMPGDLVRAAEGESEVWAREQMLGAFREAYRRRGRWDDARAVYNAGRVEG